LNSTNGVIFNETSVSSGGYLAGVLSRSHYNSSGATIADLSLEIKVTIVRSYYPGDSIFTVKNLKISSTRAAVNITPSQALFYGGPSNYFLWEKDRVILKSNSALTTSAVNTGDLIVSGSATFLGNVIVEGELSSHPLVSAATSVSNTGGTVIQNVSFDTFGHATSTASTNLDSRFLKLESPSQTITGDVTITGNVYVTGGSTLIDSQMSTADTVIILNAGEAGAGITSGFSGVQIDRGTLVDYVIGLRESDMQLVLGEYIAGANGIPVPDNLQALTTRQNAPIANGVM